MREIEQGQHDGERDCCSSGDPADFVSSIDIFAVLGGRLGSGRQPKHDYPARAKAVHGGATPDALETVQQPIAGMESENHSVDRDRAVSRAVEASLIGSG